MSFPLHQYILYFAHLDTCGVFSVPVLDCSRTLFLALDKYQTYVYFTLSSKMYTNSATENRPKTSKHFKVHSWNAIRSIHHVLVNVLENILYFKF